MGEATLMSSTDKPAEIGARWQPIDSRQAMAKPDADLLAQVLHAMPELYRLVRQFPAIMTMAREAMTGHPKAASLTRNGEQRPWCWVHGQTTKECEEEGDNCAGELLTGPSDPTGNAALISDRAKRRHRDLTDRMSRLVHLVADAVAIAADFPVEPIEPATLTGPGEEWCRSCWKDDHYCEPITVDRHGHAYYAGLCRWCGDFNAANGFEPPTWILEARHRGERITSTQIREEKRRRAERTGKGKGKALRPPRVTSPDDLAFPPRNQAMRERIAKRAEDPAA
jgi:hypothetical protein